MDAERENTWSTAALAVLAALYLILWRPGYSVMGGGDFALYLAHAQAIATLQPYGATFFIFNPANAIMSPAAYPPGLPLLLVPLVAVLGIDLNAVRLLMLASLLATLWGLHRLALPTLGPRWSAVLVLAAGLSPAILMRRDAIGSDMPFAAWCMLALLGARGRPALLAIGVAMAILTRSIGIVLAAAIALDLVLRPGTARRRLMPALIAGVAVALVGMLWLRVDNTTYAGYFARLYGSGMGVSGLVRHFIDTGQAYAFALVELFGLSFGRLANYPILLALAALIAAGLIQRLRRGFDAIALFVILYIGALIAFPVHMEPTRYALPILPLLLLLALEFCAPRLGRHGPALALATLAILYLPFYAQHNARAVAPLNTDSADFIDLIDKIRATPPGTLFLARNPRIFALFGARPAVSWPERLTADSLGDTIARFRPVYVIEEKWRRGDDAAALLAAMPIIHENPLYRLRSIPAATPGR